MRGQNNNKILFGFFHFGCEWETLCQHNLLYYDFHADNILFNEDGDFHVIDIDDIEDVKFPEEIQKYANGLSNLYVNFGMELGAAFRYGFINVAGNIGNVLYDILYNNNGLTALNSTTSVRQVDTDTENLIKIYSEWKSLVDNSFVKKITNGTYEYGEFSYIELMERNSDDYYEFKEKYKDNRDLLKHEYQVYFANGLMSENDFDIATSAFMLCQIEFYNQEYFLAGYYYTVARERIAGNEACLISLEKDITYAIYLFVSQFGQEETRRLLDYIFHETLRLRIQRNTENYFYEIWYWSDFAKEFSIKDYIKKRPYGCYKCDDCNNIDFFDGLEEKCGKCASKKIQKISLQEYINLKVSILMSEDASASEESFADNTHSKIELHELNSVELIPIYVQMINTYEKNGEYDAAIKLAKQIEAFIQSNPNVCDEKGYIIEKARAGGQIFYSTTTPNKILKRFLEGIENVRNDYESYICYKLCVLYNKMENCTVALEYAEKIIELANCSPRWIEQRYVKCAYLLMKTYYEDKGDKKEALIYSNILFTYNMLDKIDNEYPRDTDLSEIRDTITSLMDIGNSNANAGNISLSYSCYILALRIHIYHHGIKHPKTAIIYANIAKLLASKKLYDEAYDFWAVSLMLLESSKIKQYKKQISEIEIDISKCLSESGYQGSISQWKKECMTEQAFNIFPEKRFENNKSSDNETSIIEISGEEMFNEYVVYNK